MVSIPKSLMIGLATIVIGVKVPEDNLRVPLAILYRLPIPVPPLSPSGRQQFSYVVRDDLCCASYSSTMHRT